MRLKQLAANCTQLNTPDRREYFFSYGVLVAGYDPNTVTEGVNGYWFVSEKISSTTTRHIKKYLENLYESDKTCKVSLKTAEDTQLTLTVSYV